jgi:hypothetical protein
MSLHLRAAQALSAASKGEVRRGMGYQSLIDFSSEFLKFEGEGLKKVFPLLFS